MTKNGKVKQKPKAETLDPAASAHSPGGQPLPFRKSFVRDWVEVIFYGLAILMFLNGYCFQNYQIPTSSMENSLLIGDHLTANKFVFAPYSWSLEKKLLPIRDLKRGDVIVFKYPGDARQDYIKRLVGLPGDEFEIRNDQVWINGKQLEENYTFYKTQKTGVDRDPDNKNRPLDYDVQKPGLENAYFRMGGDWDADWVKRQTAITLRKDFPKSDERNKLLETLRGSQTGVIPEGFYLMMGDNRNRSEDSRVWGFVPRSLIEGRAHFVWWSYGEDEGSHRLTGGDLIMSYLRVPLTFWTRTRWQESFSTIK